MKGDAQHVCNPDRPSAIFLPGRVCHRDHNRGCEPDQLAKGRRTLSQLAKGTSNIEIGAFLIAAGNGPEKQELLRLIATLV